MLCIIIIRQVASSYRQQASPVSCCPFADMSICLISLFSCWSCNPFEYFIQRWQKTPSGEILGLGKRAPCSRVGRSFPSSPSPDGDPGRNDAIFSGNVYDKRKGVGGGGRGWVLLPNQFQRRFDDVLCLALDLFIFWNCNKFFTHVQSLHSDKRKWVYCINQKHIT